MDYDGKAGSNYSKLNLIDSGLVGEYFKGLTIFTIGLSLLFGGL